MSSQMNRESFDTVLIFLEIAATQICVVLSKTTDQNIEIYATVKLVKTTTLETQQLAQDN